MSRNTTTTANGAPVDTSYHNLSPSVQFTVPRTGTYRVRWGGILYTYGDNGGSGSTYLTPKWGAAATADADGIFTTKGWEANNQHNDFPNSGNLDKALNASDVIKLQFRATNSQFNNPSAQVANAWLAVTPVSVT